MEESIKIKAILENKKHVLHNPDFFKDEPLLCFTPSEEALKALKVYFQSINYEAGAPFELVLRPYPNDPTERARKFFFALRDRLAEHMGDVSKEHKDHLYRSCIREFAFLDINYGVKDSIRNLTRYELWQVTERMMDWLADAEAYTGDLEAEYNQVKKEYKENEGTGD